MAFDLGIAALLGVFVTLPLIFIAWWWEDRSPAWKNAEPLGRYEFQFIRGASKRRVRRRKNVVDLTPLVLTKKDGVESIKELVEKSKRADFFMPGQNKQELIQILGMLSSFAEAGNRDSNGHPFLEWRDYRLWIFGLGSLFSSKEVAVTILKKEEDLRSYSHGWTGGPRSREFVVAKQYVWPGKRRKFLGRKMVRFSVLYLVPNVLNADLEQVHNLNQALQGFMQYIPIMHYFSDVQPIKNRLKITEDNLKQARIQLNQAETKVHKQLAQSKSFEEGMSLIERYLGKTGKLSTPLSGALIVLVPVILAALGEALSPNPSPTPVLFVFVGVLLVAALFAKR